MKLSPIDDSEQILNTLRCDPLKDFEWGGVALQDSSQGLHYAEWTLSVDDEGFLALNSLTKTHILENVGEVTQVGIAFDVNMNYAYLYVKDSVLYWRYYDSVTNNYQRMVINDVHAAVCTLDDIRPGADVWSSIFLVYSKNGHWYYRKQRERYLIEHLIAENMLPNLLQISMGRNYKLQLRCYEDET